MLVIHRDIYKQSISIFGTTGAMVKVGTYQPTFTVATVKVGFGVEILNGH